PFGEIDGAGTPARRGVRSGRPDSFLRGECGTAQRFRAARAVRFDLLVRGYPPHAESGGRAPAASAVHAAGNNGQNHGLSPAIMESGVDTDDGRQRPVLEIAGPGGEKLRS